MSCTVTIKTAKGEIAVRAEKGSKLLPLLIQQGIYADAPCGGNGTCGRCLVRVSGEVSPMTERERHLLGSREGRLACICEAMGDCTVEVDPKAEKMAVQVDSYTCKEFELTPRKGVGAAIDIGTTTVAVYIYDLSSGELTDVFSEVNRQRIFGADVVSRIEYSVKNGHTALSNTVISQINSMLGGRRPDRVTVAGNTVMEHLLAGLDPSGMARVPFTTRSLFGGSFTPSEGLLEAGEVYLLPAVSAFVGGDMTGAVVAAGLDEDGPARMLVDIGTNGEIALRSEGRLLCCATAAGPAFEGCGISCGMGGLPGAVRGIRLGKKGLELSVIGNTRPVGICGSGLIDALAVMLELGAMDETGRLDEDCEGVFEENGELCFRISEDITLTQGDIRAVQTAKAAICGGMLTLIKRAGLEPCDISTLYIAGGFGSGIDPENAGKIGLYPSELSKKTVVLGNAAGRGAAAALLNDGARERCEAVAATAEYIELSSDPDFGDYFIDAMLF